MSSNQTMPGGSPANPGDGSKGSKAGNDNQRPEQKRDAERGSATRSKKNPGKRPSQGGNAH